MQAAGVVVSDKIESACHPIEEDVLRWVLRGTLGADSDTVDGAAPGEKELKLVGQAGGCVTEVRAQTAHKAFLARHGHVVRSRCGLTDRA